MRGGEQQARDVILAAHRLNQPVADLSFVCEAAVFHGVSFKFQSFEFQVAGGWLRCPPTTSYQLQATSEALSSRLSAKLPSIKWFFWRGADRQQSDANQVLGTRNWVLFPPFPASARSHYRAHPQR